MDDFKYLDDSLWVAENNTIHCTKSRIQSCARAARSNLYYTSMEENDMPPTARDWEEDDPKKFLLTFWLKNNCEGNQCCFNLQQTSSDLYRCTEFTTAQLTSKSFYSYGVYVFVARPVPRNPSNSNIEGPNAISCFSLQQIIRNNRLKDAQLEIGVCFSNRNPRMIQFVWSYGKKTHKRLAQLQFDASRQIAAYGIDWRPDRITWFINNEQVTSLNSDTLIPSDGVRIKISVLPMHDDIGWSPNTVQLVSNVYRVAFKAVVYDISRRSDKGPPGQTIIDAGSDRTELFILDRKTFRKLHLCIVAFIFLLLCSIIFCYWWYAKKSPIDLDGYIRLSESGTESNSNPIL